MEAVNKTHRQIITFNKNIGHLYVPNLKARLIDNDGGYFIKTNSQGFRSNIEFNKKKSKKKRILFFGDSNTAADGVSNEQRYSDLIQNYFDAEVFNYAVSGTGTDQQFLIWEKYAKEVEADLIIIGVLVENIERNKVQYREALDFFTKKRSLISKPFFNISGQQIKLENFPVNKFDGNFDKIDKNKVQWQIPSDQKKLYHSINYLRKTKIYKKLNKDYNNSLTQARSFLIKNFYQPYKDYRNKNCDGYKLLENILKKFLNSIGDIPTILMPIPTYHYYFDGARPIYQDFFKSFEDEKEKRFIFDPLACLKNLDLDEKKKLPLSDDKAHFSSFGHKIIAQSLKEKIEKLNIFSLNKSSKIDITSNSQGKPCYILGISAFYHDSAATLIKNGKIIAAAQEERFTRKKNDQSFPRFAINFCLEEAGINPSELEAVVYYDNAYLTLERIMSSFLKTYPNSLRSWNKYIPKWLTHKLFVPSLIRKQLKYKGKILHTYHHRSHLASAFFPSPFKSSAILTIDGVGEWTTASIGIGKNNTINMVKEISFPDSVGLLYSSFTQFLGFKVNSGEYKMMGLAPYGEPIYYDLILNNLIKLNEDGSIKINQKYFNYLEGSVMTNKNFENLFKIKKRVPESKILREHMNIASSIQKVTEKIILKMAEYTKKITGENNLCLSGGVALNCVANGVLLKSKIFKNIWVQPASGDAGSSLGCAYDVYYSYLKNLRKNDDENSTAQKGSLLGPSWSLDEIKSFLDSSDINYEFYQDEKMRNKIISELISESKVIGLFQGRTEFGPRALGSRSIIGDARNQDMQTKINLKIKFRESFRPFAPAILIDKVSRYFELNQPSPYMMFVAPVNVAIRKPKSSKVTDDMLEIVREKRSEVPAITHVDYSARIQTVDHKSNEKFFNLLKEFDNKNSCPLLINTSFNVRGEPIVNSPFDAYKCFERTNMDVLVLENFLIYKDKQKKNLEKEKIYIKEENTGEEFQNSFKEINKIYKNLKEFSNFNLNFKTGWEDCSKESRLQDIFEIPKELDKEDFSPEKMGEIILNYWRDKKFAEAMKRNIIKLMEISKKNKTDNYNYDGKISENIYEMF